jgi:hypothetical protein
MHTGPVPGKFETEWKPTKTEDNTFFCRQCGSSDVWYRVWESSCGGYEDIKYECRGCGRTWWVESDDA